jgi:hypothetical protein
MTITREVFFDLLKFAHSKLNDAPTELHIPDNGVMQTDVSNWGEDSRGKSPLVLGRDTRAIAGMTVHINDNLEPGVIADYRVGHQSVGVTANDLDNL